MGMRAVINGLDNGLPKMPVSTVTAWDALPQIREAQDLAIRKLLHAAAIFARERRACRQASMGVAPLSRAASTATMLLVKGSELRNDGYIRLRKTVPQVPLIAAALDEPQDDDTVEMLTALPHYEADYYAEEARVVDNTAKASAIFSELEVQYGFVGGSVKEYVSYFHRPDLPSNMWRWDLWSNCKAVAGFTAVSKKGSLQAA